MIEKKERLVLDWDGVLDRVADECCLKASWELLAQNPLSTTIEEARTRFALVEEIWQLLDQEEDMPLLGLVDFREEIEQIRTGILLDLADWVQIKNGVEQLFRLKKWLLAHFEEYTLLSSQMVDVEIDPILTDTLVSSFDPLGELNEQYYPKLFQLRQKQLQLRQAIEEELRNLLQDSNIQGQLQEAFVTERNGRYVLPMKKSYRRKMGISHGTSRSGETVYVEPLSVLPLSNALREAESDYEQEIRNILDRLSKMVRGHIDSLLFAFGRALDLDVKRACAVLGRRWRGSIPRIGTEGVLIVKNLRHPLLIGKGDKVVGNDFYLDGKRPAVIFSGPNAGGKTVALKSIGLACLMMRLGLPIPACEDVRIDFFTRIFADIGDSQTVQQGLSSFSAHLLYINQVLQQADQNSLILFDEIGMGTDPTQGSAIAQAVVEQLLEQGARLVVTTHFTRLKALASVDTRFSMAAMEFIDGRPTYRLLWGEIGDSHALSLAKRMALPEMLLWRAGELLSSQEKKIASLVDELEKQKKEWDEKQAQLQFLEKECKDREERLARKERVMEEQQEKIKEANLAEFRNFIKTKEREVKHLMKLVEATHSPKKMKSHLRDLRAIKEEIEPKKETVQPIAEDVPLRVGDVVDVITMGGEGTIQKVLARDRYEVSISGFPMVLGRDEIAGKVTKSKKSISKQRRSQPKVKIKDNVAKRSVMRSSQNTCDVRGCRVEEAFLKLETFFDQQILDRRESVFILHGHGTGALKKAIRNWLPSSSYVRSWRPAKHAEGGDAYTVVQL